MIIEIIITIIFLEPDPFIELSRINKASIYRAYLTHDLKSYLFSLHQVQRKIYNFIILNVLVFF